MAMHHFPPLPNRVIPKLYDLGLGPIIGRFILLLTTTGRKSGLPRTTPLQYEKIDGAYYAGSARGAQADWFRNLVANPRVEVWVKSQRFCGQAEAITAPDRIADFLEFRLRRHPRMMGMILKRDGLPAKPTRADLEAYAQKLAMVIIRVSEAGASVPSANHDQPQTG
jgi:deazaflavin-dependent oxidoreductase (nitroreductase family)